MTRQENVNDFDEQSQMAQEREALMDAEQYSAAPFTIVGRYFHAREADGTPVMTQGRIVGQVNDTTFLCEMLSWHTGLPCGEKLFDLRQMLAWSLYDTIGLMKERWEEVERHIVAKVVAKDAGRLIESVANRIVGKLQLGPTNKRCLHRACGGSVRAEDLDAALQLLLSRKTITKDLRPTSGRPADVYSLCRASGEGGA